MNGAQFFLPASEVGSEESPGLDVAYIRKANLVLRWNLNTEVSWMHRNLSLLGCPGPSLQDTKDLFQPRNWEFAKADTRH